MSGQFSSRIRRFSLVKAVIAVAAPLSFAQTNTWDGGGTDDLISDNVNWNNNTLPAFTSATQALFAGSTRLNLVVNTNVAFGPSSSGSPPAAAIAFSSNFNLSATGGSGITLYGSSSGSFPVIRTNSAATGVTIGAPIRIFATSPAASPLGNLLVLAANNATSVTALNITGDLSLASGSTASTYDIRFSAGSGATTALSNVRIGGAISGLGSLANGGFNWGGDLIIANNQSLSSSNININNGSGWGTINGRLVLGESTSHVQTWNNITLNNSLKLIIAGDITANTFASTATSFSPRILGNASGGTLKLSSGSIASHVAIGGTGANENNLNLVKQNPGTLTLSGNKTYTGSTQINGGTLVLDGSLASPITLNAGATLSGEGSTSASLTFGHGTSTLNFNLATPTAALTANNVLTAGSPNVIVTPSATVTHGIYTVLKTTSGFGSTPLSTFALATRAGSLSYSGNDLIYAASAATAASLVWTGTDPTNPSAWDTVNTVNWTNTGSPDRFYTGDAVRFDDSASSFIVNALPDSQSPGSITISNTSPYTFNGAITGSGSLTKWNGGSATFNGPLTRNAGIIVHAGTLSFANATNSITGGITVNGGELRFAGSVANSLSSQPLTLAGGTIAYTGSATTTNDTQTININNVSSIKVDTSKNLTWRVGGKISGNANWTKSGNGILALGRNSDTGPANDFTGSLTVTAGTLDIRHPDSLGSTNAPTNIQTATLLVQNFGQSPGTRSYAEPLNFAGISFLTNLNQEIKAFVTQFTGTLNVSGTLALSTAITPGSTSPSLQFNTASIITTTASEIVLGRRADSYPSTIDPLDAQSITISSPILGPGSLSTDASASPASIYILNGSHAYTGNTTINAASLLVNGTYTGGGSFFVNAGTLGGNGSITGDVSLNSAEATLSPGSSIESLNVVGSISLNSGSIIIEFDGTNPNPIDSLNLTESLDLGSSSLILSQIGANLDPTQSYVFMTYGNLVGSSFAHVSGLPSTHSIQYNFAGNNIAIVPIPEPTIPGILLATLSLILRRTR